jgi:hypothetical protein
MPRYFFDVTDHEGKHRDDVGIECADFEAARQHAAVALPEMMREMMPNGMHSEVLVEIRDSDERELMRATIKLDMDRRPH